MTPAQAVASHGAAQRHTLMPGAHGAYWLSAARHVRQLCVSCTKFSVRASTPPSCSARNASGISAYIVAEAHEVATQAIAWAPVKLRRTQRQVQL